MAFSDDAKRILRSNLENAWKKVGFVVGVVLAWIPAWEGAEYLGLSGWHRFFAVAGFYLVAGISLIAIFLFHSLREAYERLGPAETSEKALTELASKFVGHQKLVFSCAVRIMADGSSETISDVTLKAFTQPLQKLEYTFTTPSLPDGTPGELSVTVEGGQQSGINITHEILRSSAKECYWTINFTPDLRPGSDVNYRFIQKCLERSFALDMDDLSRRRLELEHYSQRITHPTARYILRVTFARELNPESISYDVWLGKGGVRHMGEYVRAFNGKFFESGRDQDNRLFGKLDIPHPIQGLRYVITWKPQKAKGAAR